MLTCSIGIQLHSDAYSWSDKIVKHKINACMARVHVHTYTQTVGRHTCTVHGVHCARWPVVEYWRVDVKVAFAAPSLYLYRLYFVLVVFSLECAAGCCLPACLPACCCCTAHSPTPIWTNKILQLQQNNLVCNLILYDMHRINANVFIILIQYNEWNIRKLLFGFVHKAHTHRVKFSLSLPLPLSVCVCVWQ